MLGSYFQPTGQKVYYGPAPQHIITMGCFPGTESIRTQVNSYLSQFVLILVNSYSVFGQFVLIVLNLVNSYFGRFVLSLVNSYSYQKYDFDDIYHITNSTANIKAVRGSCGPSLSTS